MKTFVKDKQNSKILTYHKVLFEWGGFDLIRLMNLSWREVRFHFQSWSSNQIQIFL